MSISRKEIGSFAVKTDSGDMKRVIVSQNVVSTYDKDHSFSGKFLNLEDIDGPNVVPTDRDGVFVLEDGTVLRLR